MRVIVADDDTFARRLIKSVLQAAGTVVVAEAENGREAVELALHHRPDLMVMDVVMPVFDGILATRKILEANPDQLVVVLTSAGEDDFGLLAVQAGAVGYLSKELDIDSLPRALEAVREGEGAISRRMTSRLVAEFRDAPNGSSGLRPIKGPLTEREWEVIDLLTPGNSPDDVADALFISLETVRTHIKNIMRKLGVHSRADAIAAADRLRTVTSSAVG
jgi:DNA-binding NarL/FixJ family response regulator